MKEISAKLYVWGKFRALDLQHNPYPDTNILHRYSIEGDVQTARSKSRILCHDPNRQPQYVIDINAAWHVLPEKQKDCIYGKYVIAGHLVNDEGQPITALNVAQNMEMSLDTFNRNVSRGRQAIVSKVKK